MKKFVIAILICLVCSIGFAATKNVVPRADSEGSLGTNLKYWNAAYIDNIYGQTLDVEGTVYGSMLWIDGFLYGNGSMLTGVSGGGANPTANSIPRSTGAALLDSAIYNVGSNVGIGTTLPRAILDVNGEILPLKIASVVVVDGTRYAKTSAGLQDAFDDYPSGTSFWLTDGTYNITTSVNVWNSSVTISGGKNAVLQRAAGQANDLLKLYGDYIRVSGITIDGNAPNGSGHSLSIVDGADYATLDNLKIINSQYSGIFIDGNNSFLHDIEMIDNPATSDTSYGAIEVWSQIGGNFENIYIKNSPIGLAAWSGYWNLSNAQFKDIKKAQGSAIMIYEGTKVNLNNILIDTAYYGSQGANGIFFTGSGSPEMLNSNISNVIMRDVGGVGIELLGSNINISDIDISLYNGGAGTSTDQHGLYINGNDVNVSNFKVSGSHINGIVLASGNRLHLANGIIFGSEVVGFRVEPTSGYYSDATLDNVTIKDSGTYGVSVFSNSYFSNLKIINPTYVNNASGDLDANARTALGNVVIDSRIYTLGNVGINIKSSSVGLQVGGGSPSWAVAMVNTTDAYLTGDVEIDGALYVDGFIYGNGSKLTGLSGGAATWGSIGGTVTAQTDLAIYALDTDLVVYAANPTANSISRSNGSILLDSAIYNVGSNVGIGTISPKASLEVDGILYVNTAAGNVGIGTWMPSKYLDVVASINASHEIRVKNGSGSAARSVLSAESDGAMLKVGCWGTGYSGTGVAGQNQTDTCQIQGDNGTSPANIQIGQLGNNPMYFGTDSQMRIAILGGGNVGIGSAIPQALLVVGNASARTTIDGLNDILVKDSIEVDGQVYSDGTSFNYFMGNVGIGTTKPRQRLEIDQSLYVDTSIYGGDGTAAGAQDSCVCWYAGRLGHSTMLAGACVLPCLP
jgi:hypothetical protein